MRTQQKQLLPALLPAVSGAVQLSVRDVSFAYASQPSTPVLDNVSLQVQPRSITCIVGKSGSGKSTLVSLLSGLLVAKHGSIVVGELNAEQSRAWLQANVGVMQQHDKSLMSGSVFDNIEYGKVIKYIYIYIYIFACYFVSNCSSSYIGQRESV